MYHCNVIPESFYKNTSLCFHSVHSCKSMRAEDWSTLVYFCILELQTWKYKLWLGHAEHGAMNRFLKQFCNSQTVTRIFLWYIGQILWIIIFQDIIKKTRKVCYLFNKPAINNFKNNSLCRKCILFPSGAIPWRPGCL